MKSRVLVMLCDPDGAPRAWATAQWPHGLEAARERASVELEAYRKEHPAYAEISFTERAEVFDE